MSKFKRLFKGRGKAVFLTAACIFAAALAGGCQAVRYYSQAIHGQLQIFSNQRPIEQLLASTNTPPRLKKKFEEVLALRRFAAEQLKLPADGNYLKYADLHREFVVWNVTAAPKLSLQPKMWWFPIVGYASYRGYFSEKAARDYAAKLEKQGWDVYVGGVETYSTLGWFRDPLLNTFIDESESDLAEIIFHELTHQRLFIPGDTDFNEAFATAVAEEGLRRWLAAAGRTNLFSEFKVGFQRHEQFIKLIMRTREKLEKVYDDPSLSDSAKLAQKEKIIADLRAEHERLKALWGGKSGYDEWFSKPINNARLNTISAYYELVPAFHSLIESNGGDLEKFYHQVEQLGKLPIGQRHQFLRSLLKSQPVA